MEDDERAEELSALSAIYPELLSDHEDPFSVSLDLPIAPSRPLLVHWESTDSPNPLDARQCTTASTIPHIQHDTPLSHLPPLRLHLTLPLDYPTSQPPSVGLTTESDWLPKEKVRELELEAAKLWEEYGRGQTAFVYIDFLQQAAENGFHVDQHGPLVLPATMERELVEFDTQTKLAKFREGTYDCGICLEPKKGLVCHKMERCGHVFCLQCLHDFYNNAISEGDVVNVTCLDPGCGKEGNMRRKHKRRPIHPRELLLIGIKEDMVRRFVDMKRKKQIESDKTTVFCPRTWCQGPARSPKYPPIPNNLADYIIAEEPSDGETGAQAVGQDVVEKSVPSKPADPSDRLAVCERCSLAFCRVCFMGWHGQYQRCHPRDPNELSVEEKASYDYILRNTTPCPTCGSPTQKTHGCNHMQCFQCSHHFCYLCSAWLEPANPYKHFNTPGRECYQRLFELEEGDDGQGPADGRGFGGGRRYEQMAIEAAREADAAEAAAAAAAAANAELVAAAAEEAELAAAQAQIAEMELAERPDPESPVRARRRPGRGARNLRARGGAAPAIAPAGRGRGQARPALQQDERIQRFVRMAEMDEEDGWDSDELGDDDERFVIR